MIPVNVCSPTCHDVQYTAKASTAFTNTTETISMGTFSSVPQAYLQVGAIGPFFLTESE